MVVSRLDAIKKLLDDCHSLGYAVTCDVMDCGFYRVSLDGEDLGDWTELGVLSILSQVQFPYLRSMGFKKKSVKKQESLIPDVWGRIKDLPHMDKLSKVVTQTETTDNLFTVFIPSQYQKWENTAHDRIKQSLGITGIQIEYKIVFI